MTLNESLLNVLGQLDDDTLIAVWNEYCHDNMDEESVIFPNEEYAFNECVGYETNPFKVACMLDDWHEYNGYFFNGIYGISSFDDPYDVVNVESLADEIEDNSSILTNNTNEDDWYEIISDDFKVFLELNGIYKYDFEHDYLPEELLRDWDEILEEIEEKQKED